MHATNVARALAIPLIVHVDRITIEALNGDHVMLDGEQGIVHLRPDETVVSAFRDKIAMEAEAQQRYASIRDKPAMTKCGSLIELHMNAGLMPASPRRVVRGRLSRSLTSGDGSTLNASTLLPASKTLPMVDSIEMTHSGVFESRRPMEARR